MIQNKRIYHRRVKGRATQIKARTTTKLLTFKQNFLRISNHCLQLEASIWYVSVVADAKHIRRTHCHRIGLQMQFKPQCKRAKHTMKATEIIDPEQFATTHLVRHLHFFEQFSRVLRQFGKLSWSDANVFWNELGCIIHASSNEMELKVDFR